MEEDSDSGSCCSDSSSENFSIDEHFYEQQRDRREEHFRVLNAMYPLIGSLHEAVTRARGKRCVVLVVDSPDSLKSGTANSMMHPLVISEATGYMLLASALQSARDRTAFLSPQLLAKLDMQEPHSRAVALFLDLRAGFKRITGIVGVADVDGLFRAAVPVPSEPDAIPLSLQITAQTTADSVRDTLASLLLFDKSRLSLLECEKTPLAPEILELLAGSFLVVDSIFLVCCCKSVYSGLTDSMLDQLAPVLMTAHSLSLAYNIHLRSPDFVSILGRDLEILDITCTGFDIDAIDMLGRSLPPRLRVLRLSGDNQHGKHLILEHVSKKLSVQEVEVVGDPYGKDFVKSVNNLRPPTHKLKFKYLAKPTT